MNIPPSHSSVLLCNISMHTTHLAVTDYILHLSGKSFYIPGIGEVAQVPPEASNGFSTCNTKSIILISHHKLLLRNVMLNVEVFIRLPRNQKYAFNINSLIHIISTALIETSMTFFHFLFCYLIPQYILWPTPAYTLTTDHTHTILALFWGKISSFSDFFFSIQAVNLRDSL